MRSALCVLVAALAGGAVVGCSSSSQEVEGGWGPVRDGVQAMLYSPRGVWKVGEQVQVRLRLRNVKGEIKNFPSSADLTLRITRSDDPVADDVDYVTLAPEGIRLSPGQVLNCPLRTYPTDPASAKVCKGRGLYRFRGKLGELELPPLEVRVE